MTPYFNISLQITFNDNVIVSRVERISMQSSVESITDKATIVLPREYRNAIIKDTTNGNTLAGTPILNLMKVGDKVKIEGGYDDHLQTEFEGYITSIHADIPLVIECEDESWQLKRTKRFNKTFTNTTVKKILQYIAPNYKLELFGEDRPIGKIAIENATAYEVLIQLKEKYFVRSFFRNGVLNAGLPVNLKGYAVHQFNLNRNVRRGTDLTYQTKESRRMYVKAKSLQKGTSKYVYYEFGDKDGEVKELTAPMNLNKADLQKFAKDYFESFVYDGYSGSFSSWAIPQTRAGDTADLVDPNYPDKHRDGRFYITDVTIDVNRNDGYKRINKISKRLSGNNFDPTLKK